MLPSKTADVRVGDAVSSPVGGIDAAVRRVRQTPRGGGLGLLAQATAGRQGGVAPPQGGRVVEESEAPAAWVLSDRAGNRVCIASWPDGAEPGSAAGNGSGGD